MSSKEGKWSTPPEGSCVFYNLDVVQDIQCGYDFSCGYVFSCELTV